MVEVFFGSIRTKKEVFLLLLLALVMVEVNLATQTQTSFTDAFVAFLPQGNVGPASKTNVVLRKKSIINQDENDSTSLFVEQPTFLESADSCPAAQLLDATPQDNYMTSMVGVSTNQSPIVDGWVLLAEHWPACKIRSWNDTFVVRLWKGGGVGREGGWGGGGEQAHPFMPVR